MKQRILFICLGNICRSPAAEGIFQQLVDDRGLSDDFHIDSAAIGPWHIGDLPDKRMRECGKRHGYLFNSRARQFSSDDFRHFDLIIGMDQDNLRAIRSKAKSEEDGKKIRLMADFLRHHPHHATIPDPYYGVDKDFELVIELLEDACMGLLDVLLHLHKPKPQEE
ncbi:MAG: low molecular weight phosphotyrosine protein phosphatase [Prevotella sp.]|nr:low molecular weight phosphotyrosine protein phosphatase [Prevotella sp.]